MAWESRQFNTKAIILSRTDYGEADRIITFITPLHGKVKAVAKGVRKAGAKLAGALELFSITDLTLVAGRGEMHTITSARLSEHFGYIVKDISRTNAAYEHMRILNRATEEKTDEAYFELLEKTLSAINDSAIPPEHTDLWFKLQLLKLGGHSPNLKTDSEGRSLSAESKYNFDLERMCFVADSDGEFGPEPIKYIRIGLAAAAPRIMHRVKDSKKQLAAVQPLVQSMLTNFVRV
ncbi:MAG TPA: DNA repair protein RecO [Candidatus Saccharimonadales bacterium]|nr:DNA repair protein RecO [Candidatus Saccharimonadales bacterium]